ncbi:MAG: o-succinylbenzoate synthase [Actinomycetota bacterium]
MRAFRIPLRTRFRGVMEREGVLLHGPHGWGEFSPFPEYGPETARRWADAALEAAAEPWPTPVRTSIPVNTTVPAVSPEEAFALVTRSGCTTAKVKVAEGDDEARVEAVRAALGRSGKLRIDVNGRWDVDTAVKTIKTLDAYDLEYVEQPVATLEEMARVRAAVDVPLAADESVRTAADPMRITGLEAADIVVLKVQPLGGVRRCMEVAEACGLPVVVSSAVETSVGIAAGVALAAALPELPYACGLGTISLLEGDVVRESLVPVDGNLPVARPEPDDASLGRWELSEAGSAEIFERFRMAESVL